MPGFSLPGLQGLPVGIDSAIGTRARRTNAATSEFLDLLNARRAGILDNDDLEFRRQFAEQPSTVSTLERFDNVINGSTNPFVTTQATIAQAGLTPLLAQRAIQNSQFAAAQGLPNTVQQAIPGAFFGIQPILDQSANAQRQAIFAQAPALSDGSFQGTAQGTLVQGAQNRQDAGTLALISQFEAQIKALTEQNARLQAAQVPPPAQTPAQGRFVDPLSQASSR